jgi:lipoprotein-anchoring transpeptidase ErfK/SrfK
MDVVVESAEMPALDRRSFLLGSATAAVAGSANSAASPIDAAYAEIYAPVKDRFLIPGVRLSQINRMFLRTAVPYESTETPGTIVIDPRARFLYHLQHAGMAIRYGVGVGRTGFGWSGTATIKDKQEWPDWYPPLEMLERQPELWDRMSRLRSGIGMPGGPGNPLGARAMYLWQGNKDTLFRIHGTFEPWTIGTNVSSGCIRMINQDVINLYDQTPIGSKIIVLAPPAGSRRRVPQIL